MHTVTFIHPLGSVKILGSILSLNSRKYPVRGSDHTVCPYFTYKPDFNAVNGASVRHIYNTADWDESLSVIPGGNSGCSHKRVLPVTGGCICGGKVLQRPFYGTGCSLIRQNTP
ncbi:MAG: penicillin acylase family protein [Marinilabiliales bacterium]|nr:penicillin acylase family protein [Marinilabiliales bacterium]